MTNRYPRPATNQIAATAWALRSPCGIEGEGLGTKRFSQRLDTTS